MKIPEEIKCTASQYFNKTSESILFIFSSLLSINLNKKRLYSKRLNSLPNDIIVTIDYRTDVSGFFSFFFSLNSAFNICEKLVPGIDNTNFSNEHLDILGEIGNMISGHTISQLQLLDEDFRMDTPRHNGFHNILASEKDFWHFSSNFDSEFGKIGLLLAIKKNKDNLLFHEN